MEQITSIYNTNACDQNQLLQAILMQNEMLKKIIDATVANPLNTKPVPMKRLPMKEQLKQDFKTAFHKKWGIES